MEWKTKIRYWKSSKWIPITESVHVFEYLTLHLAARLKRNSDLFKRSKKSCPIINNKRPVHSPLTPKHNIQGQPLPCKFVTTLVLLCIRKMSVITPLFIPGAVWHTHGIISFTFFLWRSSLLPSGHRTGFFCWACLSITKPMGNYQSFKR